MKRLMVSLIILLCVCVSCFAQFGPGYNNYGIYELNRTQPNYRKVIPKEDNNTHKNKSGLSEDECNTLIELYNGELIKVKSDSDTYLGHTCLPGVGSVELHGYTYKYYKLNNDDIIVKKYYNTVCWGKKGRYFAKGYYL